MSKSEKILLNTMCVLSMLFIAAMLVRICIDIYLTCKEYIWN